MSNRSKKSRIYKTKLGERPHSKSDYYEKNQARAFADFEIIKISYELDKEKQYKTPHKESLGPKLMILKYMAENDFRVSREEIIAHLKEKKKKFKLEDINVLIDTIEEEERIISSFIKSKPYKVSVEEVLKYLRRELKVYGWDQVKEGKEYIKGLIDRLWFIKETKHKPSDEQIEIFLSSGKIKGWSLEDFKTFIENERCLGIILFYLNKDRIISDEVIIENTKKALPEMEVDRIKEILNKIQKRRLKTKEKKFKNSLRVNQEEIRRMTKELKPIYFELLKNNNGSTEITDAFFMFNHKEKVDILSEKLGMTPEQLLGEWKEIYIRFIKGRNRSTDLKKEK